MTLHDKLKEIIDNHANLYYEALERGFSEPSIDNTVTAIIQAVAERLPGAKDVGFYFNATTDKNIVDGWNAYREEVRKVLAEKL